MASRTSASWVGVLIVSGGGLATTPIAARPATAAQAMQAHARMTSIGADPCRPGAVDGDEIVVCGRRESPYALPLYEPPLSGEGFLSTMGREAAMRAAQDTFAPCHARGEACARPLPLIGIPIGAGKKGGVRIGKD